MPTCSLACQRPRRSRGSSIDRRGVCTYGLLVTHGEDGSHGTARLGVLPAPVVRHLAPGRLEVFGYMTSTATKSGCPTSAFGGSATPRTASPSPAHVCADVGHVAALEGHVWRRRVSKTANGPPGCSMGADTERLYGLLCRCNGGRKIIRMLCALHHLITSDAANLG